MTAETCGDRRLLFAFAVHNHQPVGNFDAVIARAYARAYKPFVDAIAAYPSLKFSFHVSGSLLEWLETNGDPTVKLVADMAARGQCEVLAGTYYEALVPVAPARDVVDSVRAYRAKLEEVFGTCSEGMWLAERVFEPHVPAILAAAGIGYCALDDWHFRAAGFPGDTPPRPCIAEHDGARITVIPISQRLRYLVPFAPVHEVIQHLRGLYDAGIPMACLADDGEKFGEWPGTYKHCYEDGWLNEFLEGLQANESWLKTTTLGEAVAAVGAAGPAYLPATSYYEMTRWALPAGTQRRLEELGPTFSADGPDGDLAPGGSFRCFFHRYGEVNFFHKRVQEFSDRVARSQTKLGGAAAAVKRELWKAQANDSYWHGVFGGLYLPHLRAGAKNALLGAEKRFDESIPTRPQPPGDFDADGGDEIMLKNDDVVAVLKAAEGLSLAEFSRREPAAVLTDVAGRRPEAYHDKLAQAPIEAAESATIHTPRPAKERNLDDYLIYDRRPRRWALERVFAADAHLMGYARESAIELPPPVWTSYEKVRGGWRASGRLDLEGYASGSLAKTISLKGRVLRMEVSFAGETVAPFILGWEFGIRVSSEQPEHSSLITGEGSLSLEDPVAAGPAEVYAVADELAAWRLEFRGEPKMKVWHAPIFTVSCSESGYEKVYQGASLFLYNDVHTEVRHALWVLAVSLV